MKTLCPLFKEECHGNECKMWKNEECLLVSFLQATSETAELPEEDTETEEPEVPKWLETSTPEEIAVEILDFKKRECPDEEYSDSHFILRYYWSSKGIEKYTLPPEIEVKIQKAEFLAEKEMRKDEENKTKERLRKEKEELPSLVSQCVDFARINGLKRLTLSDVDTFILEKDLDIMQETRRAMYAMANVRLKSKK